MAEVKELDAAGFEAAVETGVTIVDFWATWCGPCKMVGPIVAEIAEEYEGKVKVGKVNVDEEPVLAMQYNVTAIPTLFVFKNGEVADQIVGFAQKDDIVKMF